MYVWTCTQVNALGPLRVVRSLLPHLRPGSSKVVLLSSKMGSQGAQDIPPRGGLVRSMCVCVYVFVCVHMCACVQ